MTNSVESGSIREKLESRCFTLPEYQRTYSWNREQVNDFIKVIEYASETDSEHYLGGIIVYSPQDKSINKIVDGQQRITTIMLLFSSIRELVEKQAEDTENEILEFVFTDYTSLIGTDPSTKKYEHFKISADLDWHCANCELPGAQPARSAKTMRDYGFREEQNGSHYSKSKHCSNCDSQQTHRRLIAPFPLDKSTVRDNLPTSFIKRAKKSIITKR